MSFLSKQLLKQFLVLAGFLSVLSASAVYGVLTLQKRASDAEILQQEADTLAVQLTGMQEERSVLDAEYAQIGQEVRHVQDEQAALLQQIDTLRVEYHGLLEQAKQAGAGAEKVAERKRMLEGLQQDVAVLQRDKVQLFKECKELKGQLQQSRKTGDTLQTEYRQLVDEKEKILDHLAELRESGAQEVLESRKQELERKREEIRDEVLQLEAQRETIEQHKQGTLEEITLLTREVQQLTEAYDSEVTRTKTIEQRVQKAPERLVALARQNKLLTERMAKMYYNLGVYYMGERKYRRALQQFLQAAELQPSDAATYFNIGYIYAEYLVNRERSLLYLQKYLKYADRSDPDIDWVKQYIATWQAWGGRKAME